MKKKLTILLLSAGLAMMTLCACGDRGAKEDILKNTQGASFGGTDTQEVPDTQDAQSNKGSSAAPDEAALSELTGVFDEIASSVEVGTAGSSLKAVPATLALMDWATQYELGDDAVKSGMEQYLAGLDESAREEFRMQFELVYADSQELAGEFGQALIDDAGCEAPNYPYDASKLTELAAMIAVIQE